MTNEERARWLALGRMIAQALAVKVKEDPDLVVSVRDENNSVLLDENNDPILE